MELTFLGATHEVTGSCYYLSACNKKILIDCGMEQGPDEYVNQEIPVVPSEIDMVLLTHAHIDHSGCIPLLYAKGYRGPIYTTGATKDLCEIMLKDSAHIQMFEAEWRNRKAKRSGKAEFIPLYNMEDAVGILREFRGYQYNKIIEITSGIQIRFIDAGHLLGSSSIEIWIEEGGIRKKLVFSGDIGNTNQPLIRDPQYIKEADYVVMESTYGDRSHKEAPDYIRELTNIIQLTFDKGGNLVIPSFAVGRTQEMLCFIRKIKEEGFVKNHDNFEVYVDSPLAVEATNIFQEHMKEYFDEEALALVERGINPIAFPGLKLSITSEESKAINFEKRPKVIISASGMCEAGRIKHHLKHNLWRAESTILFVGYQGIGTLGRTILEGASKVKLFGEEIQVHASIFNLEGVSGHADDKGLIRWISSFAPKPQKVFVVHGEDKVCDLFTDRLITELKLDAVAPYSGDSYDLAHNVKIKEVVPIRAARKAIEMKANRGTDTDRGTDTYGRLVASGERLMSIIRHKKGGANKELAKFMGQIHSLCDKWDR